MKLVARIEVPREAFLAVLGLGEKGWAGVRSR
jgi:hypothetical protein